MPKLIETEISFALISDYCFQVDFDFRCSFVVLFSVFIILCLSVFRGLIINAQLLQTSTTLLKKKKFCSKYVYFVQLWKYTQSQIASTFVYQVSKYGRSKMSRRRKKSLKKYLHQKKERLHSRSENFVIYDQLLLVMSVKISVTQTIAEIVMASNNWEYSAVQFDKTFTTVFVGKDRAELH